MEDNKLKVKNLDGNEITIDVIDIIEDRETGKQYICYTIESLDDVYVSILEEKENTFSLGEITEEERTLVEQFMNMNFEG